MLNEEDIHFFNECIHKLTENTSILNMSTYIQHGKTSCLHHSIAVAYYSFLTIKALRINCDYQSLIMGAMLHDYFLYDWHIKDPSHKFHGFRHPGFALNNAMQVRDLNKIECNIIQRHMFPLTPIPPIYRESIVVCLIDKLCSTYEIFHPNTYKYIKKKLILAY